MEHETFVQEFHLRAETALGWHKILPGALLSLVQDQYDARDWTITEVTE